MSTRTVLSFTKPMLLRLHRQSTTLHVLNTPKLPFGVSNEEDCSTTSSSFSTSFSVRKSTSSIKFRSVIQPLVICGPSGVGKGTIITKYMKELGGSQKFDFAVSHTTRKPRPGEIDGVHYHFTDVTSMKESIGNNDFLEFAEVHGNFYGTSLESLSQLESSGKIPLLDIDAQGVKSIKQRQQNCYNNNFNGPDLQAKFIFIAPPSLDLLLHRLLSRGTETEESIKKRTKNAVAEMTYGLADGNFDAVIINDDLDQACREFRDVINTLYN